MAYCTIILDRPSDLSKQDIKKLIKDDGEYVSNGKSINNVVSELNYLASSSALTFFAAKKNNTRKYVLFFNDGNMEVHCELVNSVNKYNGLFEQGSRTIEDLNRVIKKKLTLKQFSISDSQDELVCKVHEKTWTDTFKESFSSSWFDRFVILAFGGVVTYLNTTKPEGHTFWKYFLENWISILLYCSVFLFWPLIKAVCLYLFSNDGKYKKEYIGI